MKKAIYALAFAAIFASCDKDENPAPVATTPDLLRASATIEFVNDVDFQTAVQVGGALSGRNTESATPSCAVVTVSGPDYPRVFTLDFGQGCIQNGIMRSGILIITLSAPSLEPGALITMERDNYYINNHHVEGTVTYVNETTTDIPQWSRNISTGQVTTPEGVVYTHTGTQTVQFAVGVSTNEPDDNVYHITAAQHTITDDTGGTLTGTVLLPLVKVYSCSYISAGVISLTGTLYNGQLDYGDGTCDGTATYTDADGVSTTVQL